MNMKVNITGFAIVLHSENRTVVFLRLTFVRCSVFEELGVNKRAERTKVECSNFSSKYKPSYRRFHTLRRHLTHLFYKDYALQHSSAENTKFILLGSQHCSTENIR